MSRLYLFGYRSSDRDATLALPIALETGRLGQGQGMGLDLYRDLDQCQFKRWARARTGPVSYQVPITRIIRR